MEGCRMAWYYGTYSCGHEGRVNVIGPTKDRGWKIEKAFSKLCPECYEKYMEEERKKENEKALTKSKELELPELSGSEKQVAWANTLRYKVIERYEKQIEKIEQSVEKSDTKFTFYGFSTTREEFSEAMTYILETKTTAKYWIDNRSDNTFIDYIEEYRNYKKKNDIPAEVKKELEDLKVQLTITPENASKEGVVKIKYNDKNTLLSAIYIKDNDFIQIVKSLNYKWDGSNWTKEINEYTGVIDDRAAELGNKLLLAGFTVEFATEESKELAIKGTFQKENYKWIKYLSRKNELVISWNGLNDTFYKNAKKLPGAYWELGRMLVSIKFYKQIQEFAEKMHFSFSEAATDAIAQYKEKESNFTHVDNE